MSNEERCLLSFRESIGERSDQFSDTYLSQFLVARNWDIEAAEALFDNTLQWRAINNIDLLPCATRSNNLPLLVAVRGFESIGDGNLENRPGLSECSIRIANLMGGDCIHKTDKDGNPVLIDRTGYHNIKELCRHVSVEQIAHFQVSCNEFLNRVIMPECSERANRDIYQETVIFDCANLRIWQLPLNVLDYVKSVADIVQGYYPETLKRLFIVNVPPLFLATWRLIRRWLEQRTLDKIHILGKRDTARVLLEHIPDENLPTFLGGSCTCSHMPGGCVPSFTMGNVPPLVAGPENEHVSTAYNTDIMVAAKSDESLRRPT